MDAQRPLTFGILKDLDRVVRARVDGAVHETRMIRADRDQAQVERPAQVPDLCELRVPRELVEAGAELLHPVRHASVAGVAGKPHGLGAGRDGPRCPERAVLVEARPQCAVLAGEA